VYGRRFYVGLNLFCWSLVMVPLVNGLAMLWIAIEITTVVSALLVAIDDTEARVGGGVEVHAARLAGSGHRVVRHDHDVLRRHVGLGFVLRPVLPDPARRAPPISIPTWCAFAFVLAVLGYGTKMGLFPVHTWLPDAHSEAPTPGVRPALRSALLAVSFYAILRFFQIAVRTLGPNVPRETMLLTFGCRDAAIWRHCICSANTT
jgi:hydrogenase-4 component F